MPTESTINLAIVMDVELVSGEDGANGQQPRTIVQAVELESDPSFIEAADQIQIRGTDGKSMVGAQSVAPSQAGGKSVYGGQSVAPSQAGGKSVYGGQSVAPSQAGGQSVYGGQSVAPSQAGGKSVYGAQSVAPSQFNDGKSNFGGKSVYGAQSVAPSQAGGKSMYGGQSVAPSQAGGKSVYGAQSVAPSQAGGKSVYGGQSVAPSQAGGKSVYGAQSVAPSQFDGKSNFGGKSVYGAQSVAPSQFNDGQSVAPSQFNDGKSNFGGKSVYGAQSVAPSQFNDGKSNFGGKSVYGAQSVAPSQFNDGQSVAPSQFNDGKSNFGGKSVYGAQSVAPSQFNDGQSVAPSQFNDGKSNFGGKSVYGAQSVAPSQFNDGKSVAPSQFGAKSMYGGQSVAPSVAEDGKSNFGGKSVYGAQSVAPSQFNDGKSNFGAKSVYGAQSVAPSQFNDGKSNFGAKSVYGAQSVAPSQFGKSVYQDQDGQSVAPSAADGQSVYGAPDAEDDDDLRSISQMNINEPEEEPTGMEIYPEAGSIFNGRNSIDNASQFQGPAPSQFMGPAPSQFNPQQNPGQAQSQWPQAQNPAAFQQNPNQMMPYQQGANPQQLQFQLCIQRPQGQCHGGGHRCPRPCVSICPAPCPKKKYNPCCKPKSHSCCRAQQQCFPVTLCGFPQQSQQSCQESYYPPGNWNPQPGQGQGQPFFPNGAQGQFQGQMNPQGIPQQFQQNGMPPGQGYPMQNPSSFPIQDPNMAPGSIANGGMQPQPSMVNQGQGGPRVVWAGFGAYPGQDSGQCPPNSGQYGMGMQGQSYGSQGACGSSCQDDNDSDEEECQQSCCKPKATCCCRKKSKAVKCCVPFCIQTCPKKKKRCCPQSSSVRFFTTCKSSCNPCSPCKMMEVFPVCPKSSCCSKRRTCRPQNCPMLVSGIGCDRTFPSLSPLDRRRELCVPGMKMFDLTGSCANHSLCRPKCCEQRRPSRSTCRCPTVCEVYSVCTDECRRENWSAINAGKQGNNAEICATGNQEGGNYKKDDTLQSALAEIPFDSKPGGPSDPITDKAILDGFSKPNPAGQDQGGTEGSQCQPPCPNPMVVLCPMKRRCRPRPVICKLAQQSLPPQCSPCARNPCTKMMMVCPSKQKCCKPTCPPLYVECLRSRPPTTILDCSPGPMRIFSQGHGGGLCNRMSDPCRRCSALCSVREALCGRIRPPTICELRSACIDECQEQQRRRESGPWLDSYGQPVYGSGGRQQYGGGRPFDSYGERAGGKGANGGGLPGEDGNPNGEPKGNELAEMKQKQQQLFLGQMEADDSEQMAVVKSPQQDTQFQELTDTDNEMENPPPPKGYYENVTRYTRIIENRFSVERVNEEANPHNRQNDDTKSRVTRITQGQNRAAIGQQNDAKSRAPRSSPGNRALTGGRNKRRPQDRRQ